MYNITQNKHENYEPGYSYFTQPTLFLLKTTPEIRKFVKYSRVVKIFFCKTMRDPGTSYWFPPQMTNQ